MIAVSEIASKGHKEMIGLPSGLFPPKKDKWWCRVEHLVEESYDESHSCAMDDFPVPGCPKRTRPRSEVGLFTQLIMKSRNATRVPIRHPLSGLNREFISVWNFSGFWIKFYDNYRISNPKVISDYLPASEIWVDIFALVKAVVTHHPKKSEMHNIAEPASRKGSCDFRYLGHPTSGCRAACVRIQKKRTIVNSDEKRLKWWRWWMKV